MSQSLAGRTNLHLTASIRRIINLTVFEFLIGAASHAAEMGFTDTQIKTLGRWKSGSLRVIRVFLYILP